MGKKKSFQKGFSLIELAIGLVIIGVIAGVVLKGRELVEQARLRQLVQQILSYQTAVNIFREKYLASPGDISCASEVLGEEAKNGNGDGIIQGEGLEIGTEALWFWRHLFLADLIADPGTPLQTNADFGCGAPCTALGGGFTVENDPGPLEGTWLILGSKNGNSGRGALLTPSQALFLNKKLDNGNPKTGEVRSTEGLGIASGKCINAHGHYNVSVKEKVCVLYVRMN